MPVEKRIYGGMHRYRKVNYQYRHQVFESKKVSPETAIQAVQSGMRVFVAGNCSVPRILMKALVARAPMLENVEIFQLLPMNGVEYVDPALAGHLHINTAFIGDQFRKAVNEGRADFTPCFLSEVPILLRQGVLPIDVAIINVGPPDEHGWCSLGVEAGIDKTPSQVARIVIAEMNEAMPRVLGDSFIHISELDYIVPTVYPLHEIRMGEPSAISRQIASHIAALIEDGSTLQTGIGEIPNAVLSFLGGKKDLGIHSELFSDGVVDLVEAGVITGDRKTLHPGKIIAGFVVGTERLYRFVDNNPIIELHPQEYVNDPFVIARNAKMVAINSAIEVDLTGQVCADSIGTRFYSGVGGQVDFIYGASRSEGGKPIIALPSTATLRGGNVVSRIVPILKEGAGVTTSRNHVHYVATEYGIADLYGKTIRQRIRALIAIAHPNFREELERKARELKWLF